MSERSVLPESTIRPKRRRPVRTAVRVVLVLAIVVTVAVLIRHWPMVWVPAACTVIILLMDAALSAIERHARHEAPLPALPEETRRLIVVAREEKVGVQTAVAILAGLFAIAVVLASALLDAHVVALGAVVTFLWMTLFGMPLWIAAINQEVEIEREALLAAPGHAG